jgi:general secretion pathway protein B
MSYILDALKRADAERVRGQVPGLHAHPLGETGRSEQPDGAPRWTWAAGIGVGAVVLAALAWRMGADSNAPLPAPALPPMAAAEPAAAGPSVEATTPAVVTPSGARAPVPDPPPDSSRATAPRRPAPVVPSYAPPPNAARAMAEAPPASASAPVAPPAPAGVAPVKAAAAPAAKPSSSARVPLLADLPASLRQQLPALAVSGSVYSDDAASRFIMLNGEVVKEGGQPAPGLVVERIEPRSAVLRFKDERFRLPY